MTIRNCGSAGQTAGAEGTSATDTPSSPRESPLRATSSPSPSPAAISIGRWPPWRRAGGRLLPRPLGAHIQCGRWKPFSPLGRPPCESPRSLFVTHSGHRTGHERQALWVRSHAGERSGSGRLSEARACWKSSPSLTPSRVHQMSRVGSRQTVAPPSHCQNATNCPPRLDFGGYRMGGAAPDLAQHGLGVSARRQGRPARNAYRSPVLALGSGHVAQPRRGRRPSRALPGKRALRDLRSRRPARWAQILLYPQAGDSIRESTMSTRPLSSRAAAG
jgi:hypothetical protein